MRLPLSAWRKTSNISIGEVILGGRSYIRGVPPRRMGFRNHIETSKKVST
jgi:hypothetical protein